MREDVTVLVVDGVVGGGGGGVVSPPPTAVSAGLDVEAVDLGGRFLAPAFVDAHAHLELSGMRGRVPAGESLDAWIRGVIAARKSRSEEVIVGEARAGALRLVATGTTLVGDIDSTGAIATAARGLSLTVRRFREALDAGDPARSDAALKRVAADAATAPWLHEGLSPHAPYTVSAELFAGLGQLARSRAWPVAIHFAETGEEGEWLEHARGPLQTLLTRSPRASGLSLIEEAGLLNERTLLIHANHVRPEERARIRASGAAVVHCPGTHRFFGREPFRASEWLAAGVPLALGTDSLASNDDLDMGRELALFAAANSSIAPEEALATATSKGAAALGFAGEYGEIAVGARADFNAFDVHGRRGREALEAVVHGSAERVETYVGGERTGL